MTVETTGGLGMAIKAGDNVKLTVRDVTPEDEKNGLYYSYFGGLTGTADTVYADGSVCIDVDLDSLSSAAHDRHMAMQEAERKKWLEGLSGEARNRLTPEQKQFRLSYKILVHSKDVEPNKGGKPSGKKTAQAAAEDSSKAEKGSTGASETPKRLSPEDIARAEEEHLKSLNPEA